MTSYQKYSDDDLIEAYNSMIEYSGQATEELLTEIQYRGGMDSFQKKIEQKKLLAKEIEQLSNKVYSFCRKSLPLEIIKKKVHSELLSKDELQELIELKFTRYHANIYDKSITRTTILFCLVGGILASAMGSIIWGYSLYYSHGVNYFILATYPIVNFLVVQLITRKSTNNTLVFMTAFISIIISFLVGYYVASIIPLQ